MIPACLALAPTGSVADPAQAVRLVLRRLARRYQFLSTEIRLADAELRGLVTTAAPGLFTRIGVGVEVTGQLLTTVGDNPDRMRSEAAFAHLCGVAPIPASSGKTAGTGSTAAGTGRRTTPSTPWCSPGCGSMSGPGPTSTRRTAEGRSRREIIRCLQRYVARELYQALVRLPASSSSWPPHRLERVGQP